jgi:hypothetical protein
MSKIHVTGASGHLGRKTVQTLRPQCLHGLPQPNSQTQVATTTTGDDVRQELTDLISLQTRHHRWRAVAGHEQPAR